MKKGAYGVVLWVMMWLLAACPAATPVSSPGRTSTTFTVQDLCRNAVGRSSLDEVRDELFEEAQHRALQALYGEYIRAITEVENFQVLRDRLERVAAGHIYLEGNPVYKQGSNLGDVCITVTFYTTEEELADFQQQNTSTLMERVESDIVEPTVNATATPSPTATRKTIATSYGEVTSQVLNVRAGPGTSFNVLAKLRLGDEFVVLGRAQDQVWLQIRTEAGQTGWVHSGYVRTGQAISRYPLVAAPPTPTPGNCRIGVDGALRERWSQEEMGCPLGPSAVVWAAWQPFQRGQMLWRRDTDAAYVFVQGGGWTQLPDRWNESMPVPFRGNPPAGLQAPVRGFGYVWGTYDWIYQGLGWALDKEKGFCGLVQEFERGFLLRSANVGPCWQGLYNHAGEESFGLRFLKAHKDGYWQN